MLLTQLAQNSTRFLIILILLVSSNVYCFQDEIDLENEDKDIYYLLFPNETSQAKLEKRNTDSILLLKKRAFYQAKTDEAELACHYIEQYIKTSLDISFIEHHYFDSISDSIFYSQLIDKYVNKLDIWSLFCLFVGCVGVFISIILNFKKHTDKIANLLISVFVFQHAIFIIHIGLLLTNYEFSLPHSLYMSTWSSFLYGPLIYFYFKRTRLNYKFKFLDIIHLLPTLLLLIVLIPIYSVSEEEKLRIILANERPYIAVISGSKLLLLLIYMILVIRMYVKSNRKNTLKSKIEYDWQRNVLVLCSIYIISYAIYGVLRVLYIIDGFPFYLQITSISLLILYISCTAFVYPGVFGGVKTITNGLKSELNKYKKSALTQGLSLELKMKLLYLLDKEKIYRQNDMNLQKLSELLGTTRNNTSQIVNEHFKLNFFELINKYRIQEAMRILEKEKFNNVSIINVAYEVGFNNKVTFNKSFKKHNQITPSEYVKSITI